MSAPTSPLALLTSAPQPLNPKLNDISDVASQKYHDLSDRTKANSNRMKEISELQKYIGAYSKTREIYAQYRRLPPKKQEEFYAEHAGAIISCETAKRFFDGLGLKKLPSIQSLKLSCFIPLAPFSYFITYHAFRRD